MASLKKGKGSRRYSATDFLQLWHPQGLTNMSGIVAVTCLLGRQKNSIGVACKPLVHSRVCHRCEFAA